jgi:Protein of unknown function with HXXEE motif
MFLCSLANALDSHGRPSRGEATPRKPTSARAVTGLIVAIGCVLMLAAMGRAVVFLVAALGLSYGLWLMRPAVPSASRILPAYTAAVFVQCGHVAEEYQTGFYRMFPPVLGTDAWSARRFLIFNLVWLAIFVVAGFGLARGWRPGFVVALFLALGGGIGNGLGHLLLVVRAGGYFPGAYTAPLVFLAGGVLAFQLLRPPDSVVAAI